MTLTPIHHIMDDALDHIPELSGLRVCEQNYFSQRRVHNELKPLIDIIQGLRDDLMLVAAYRNTPIFYDDRDASSQYTSPTRHWPTVPPYIDKQLLRMMVGRAQNVHPAGKQVHLTMDTHAQLTSGRYWQKREGGMLLDTESLLHTYAVPQHNIHGGMVTPEGLVSYQFAFGQEVNWIFRLPHNAFWGLLSQPSTGWYPARPDRFRVMHEFITGTLDMDEEVSKRKAQDPFAFLD